MTSEQWKESVIVFVCRKVIKLTVLLKNISVVNYVQNVIQHSSVRVNSICR
jgi:hypothetical protein